MTSTTLTPISFVRSALRWFALLAMTSLLSACAIGGPRIVNHSFQFNAKWDTPDVEILDYRYGESKLPGARPPDWALKSGQVSQGRGTTGPMRVGEELFVKWRIKSTDQVYQETADLRRSMPNDRELDGGTIYFIVAGSQLHVYFISEQELIPNPCSSRKELSQSERTPSNIMFSKFCSRKITRLYPEQKLFSED